MTDADLLRLVRAVARGRIKGQRSHKVLGIGPATFWRWVKAAELRGVRFHKNARGSATRVQPWGIRSYGKLKP